MYYFIYINSFITRVELVKRVVYIIANSETKICQHQSVGLKGCENKRDLTAQYTSRKIQNWRGVTIWKQTKGVLEF